MEPKDISWANDSNIAVKTQIGESTMGKSSKRKKYFVHPSSQLKYVAFSILPALIMTLFCTYFFNVSGKLVFEIQTDTFFAQLSSIKKTMKTAESVATKETQDSIRKLKDLLDSFEDSVLLAYTEAPKKWNQAKLYVLGGLLSVLVGTSILALLYSHRIAGPLFRLKKSIKMLSAGQDIEPIRFRKKDEYQDLADSLTELRRFMKDKGCLQSQD
jgi:nitrogen fixation/metabolism regulation signal transduction histidine kinase